MSKRIWTIIAAVVVGVIILAAFMTSSRGELPVRTETARRETIINTIQTNGKIEPIQNFEAHAPVATTVKKLLVNEGDTVKKGELLLQLDDADARAQAARALAQMRSADANLIATHTGGTHEEVLSNEASLVKAHGDFSSAQRNLDAMRRLQQSGAASPAEVSEAENRLQTAQAQVNLLEQKLKERYSQPEVQRVFAQKIEAATAYNAAKDILDSSNVRAPQDGIVYSLPVRQGQYVNAGDLLLQVANLSKVQVRGFVDEPDIGRLQTGQKVSIEWDAIPGRIWEGKLTRVPTTVIVRGTRTVGEIKCEVDNGDGKLLPNINVNVTILTAHENNALTVSREAMHQEDHVHFVYQIVDGKLKRKDVETSIFNLTRIQVVKGLDDGAEVALGSTNGTPLQAGVSVHIVQGTN
ncbi:MAG TPA: efflux RND transporter periplasmic adaptor subunit [Terriglobales bacterium]|nr:efflux RND transporter periplasmic adaptor subunit [Terriglobales bacterium]